MKPLKHKALFYYFYDLVVYINYIFTNVIFLLSGLFIS